MPDYVRRGGATYRVISDQLESPRYVFNVANSGDVPFTASYTSFGEVTGTGLDWMPFGFAGGTYDSDSGLIRYGKRDIDPAMGRWVSKDPSRFRSDDVPNLYLYTNGDPINLVDFTGLQAMPMPIPWGPIAGGAAAGAAVGGLAGAIVGGILGALIISVPGDTPVANDNASCDKPPPPKPREICKLINETEVSCIYVCKPSNTLHITDKPDEYPDNDIYPMGVCPPTVAGPP